MHVARMQSGNGITDHPGLHPGYEVAIQVNRVHLALGFTG